MLKYIIQLPFEVLGQSMLGFLELIDIIQFEKAATSHESQQLLRAILPYCPAIVVKSDDRFDLHKKSIEWFNKRRCHIKFVRIKIELLCEVDLTDYTVDNIELYVSSDISLEDIGPLKILYINERVTSVNIEDDQDHTVMEVLFSLLSNSSKVRSVDIAYSNLSQWSENIKKIGPCLRELSICDNCALIKTITEYCPYLEKLSLRFNYGVSDNNILQTLANNCPHLHSLVVCVKYISSAEADADLTAFAEKCPQLEELSLRCQQLTDQSVIALAQHCSRLKMLKLYWSQITRSSLIALSERGLPLEELHFIPRIPIPSAEIAAQCAHALSWIRQLNTHRINGPVDDWRYVLHYTTGLRQLCLNSSNDHLLVPHLLVLLQGQCFTGLESLIINPLSSITPQQFSQFVTRCSKLRTLYINNSNCTSDAVLVEQARSCPHLQKVTLYNSNAVTEEGVLALAVHCRQLREIHIPYTTLTEETVRQLAQHCRRLTYLYLRKHPEYFSSKEIRALREQVSERKRTEVIAHHSNSTCCIII